MYWKNTTQFFKIYVMIYKFVKFFAFLYKIIYFDIETERKFFSKSHGKDLCDDENGIVKRLVSKALLLKEYSLDKFSFHKLYLNFNAILTASYLFLLVIRFWRKNEQESERTNEIAHWFFQCIRLTVDDVVEFCGEFDNWW